ncbi:MULTISPECIES: YggT family protein [Brevibacterium]|uniref:YGGT family protein n=3 Tax=Brevibacterium TaxID=1696 RepID=A0A150H760_9MICO|nr:MULTISPECIES: YggT family protein [Brevibacterium]KXZ57946.1 YGGT family protein [Brevibacterium ravenspurgense]MCG7300822.1 YggT family protein [Brevibacterium ravenspurgense]HJH13123.1 YggT family protein [Brevibacterium ravenspurgense]
MGYPFIIVGMLLNLYVYVLIARVIFDLIQVFSRDWRPQGFMLAVAEIIYTLTDPPVKAVRKVIPPLRLGGIALDLGFIIVFIAVQVLAGMLIRFGYTML